MNCEDGCSSSDSEVDLGRFPKLTTLFKLARPYLERNDLGVAHTERALKIAQRYLQVPPEAKESVLATIILHDIGGSSTEDQYEKGPKIASELLKTLGYEEKFIKEVCETIKTHHERLETPSEAFKILYDSDHLVRFSKEEFNYYNSQRNFNWNSMIENLYYERSKKLAVEMWKEARDRKR